ncbi:AmmeMemoRadiSam system protein A [Candidatus Micrarchaeota archaeon]|nr:AmmeMemoRadiSam system protein A [Candidatus Micrarchaeota archaeon]
MFSSEEKEFMLKTARMAIKHYLETSETLEIKASELPSQKLTEDGACFVTLHYNDQLRGCIGSLEAHRPIIMDIIENALASAFGDPRFPMLTKIEFPKIKISISVLTKPEPLPINGPDDLLNKLVPKKHGLILEKDFHRATFLPAVWDEIPDKEEFLNHLSMKAGLPPNGWKDKDVTYKIYESEEFSE